MLAAVNDQTSSPRVVAPAFTAEDVHCISAAKSFDYRVRLKLPTVHSCPRQILHELQHTQLMSSLPVPCRCVTCRLHNHRLYHAGPAQQPAFKAPTELTLMLILLAVVKVLNLVLHKLTQRQVDAAELAFLAVDEQLVDIGDDLFDYEVSSASPVLPVLSRPDIPERALAWHLGSR